MPKKKAVKKVPTLERFLSLFFNDLFESKNSDLFLQKQIEANERLAHEFKEGLINFNKYLEPPNFNNFLELSAHILELYGISELYNFHNLLIKVQTRGIKELIRIIDISHGTFGNPANYDEITSIVKKTVDKEVEKFKSKFKIPSDPNKLKALIKAIQSDLNGDSTSMINPELDLPFPNSIEEVSWINKLIDQGFEGLIIFSIRDRTIEGYIDTLILRECLRFLDCINKKTKSDSEDLSFYLEPNVDSTHLKKVYTAINELALFESDQETFIRIFLQQIHKDRITKERILWKGTEAQLIHFIYAMLECFIRKPKELPENFNVENYNSINTAVRKSFSFWLNPKLDVHFKITKNASSSNTLKNTKDTFVELLNNYQDLDKSKRKAIKAAYEKMLEVVNAVRSAMK